MATDNQVNSARLLRKLNVLVIAQVSKSDDAGDAFCFQLVGCFLDGNDRIAELGPCTSSTARSCNSGIREFPVPLRESS